jgi:hypothetical protein
MPRLFGFDIGDETVDVAGRDGVREVQVESDHVGFARTVVETRGFLPIRYGNGTPRPIELVVYAEILRPKPLTASFRTSERDAPVGDDGCASINRRRFVLGADVDASRFAEAIRGRLSIS